MKSPLRHALLAATVSALTLALTVTATGCADTGDVAGSNGESVDLPAEYAFVSHPAPTELQRPARFASACTESCVDGWSAAYSRCMVGSTSIDGPSRDCRTEAHTSVGKCLAQACEASDPVNAPSCSDACAAESATAAALCLQAGGHHASCEGEQSDVFASCWQAECLGDLGGLARMGTTFAAEAGTDEPVAAETASETAEGDSQAAEPGPPACELACEEEDLKAYLTCTAAPDADFDGCRNHTGETKAECIAVHCPAG